jgi:ABC-type nitrate/sulfonate/bicarbonate transport system permease component
MFVALAALGIIGLSFYSLVVLVERRLIHSA